MKKTKNPNEERNARAASYLISVGVHLLLLILLGLLVTVEHGGSQRGGASLAMASTIDVMIAEAAEAETTSRPQVRPTPPQEDRTRPNPPVVEHPTEDDVITNTVTQEERKPPVEKNQQVNPDASVDTPVETPDTDREVRPTPPNQIDSEARRADVDSSGSGSNLPNNTSGTGKTDHEGEVPSYGSLSKGLFGGLKNVPECKKDDADNNELTFVYDIEYDESSPLPTIQFLSSTTDRINSATIQQTMRILLSSFNPDEAKLTSGKILKGQIECRCGWEPKCYIIQQ